ncbi:hypothetical protein AKJ16_DCAP06720 [Drosera capensis]
MITRHNLAEQLREYQIRTKYDWASASIFSSSSNFTSSCSSHQRDADKLYPSIGKLQLISEYLANLQISGYSSSATLVMHETVFIVLKGINSRLS